jgi:hypothetical protein
MLRSQVGTSDPLSLRYGAAGLKWPGTLGNKSGERSVRGNRTHVYQVVLVWLATLLMCALIATPQVFAQTKGRKKKQRGAATAGGSPGEQSLTNIPLPIGHEAKGLVLPDFDTDGRLKGRFEAGTARRLDEQHMGFEHLKITTYTPESKPDLQIDMQTSVLDLKTRILSSQQRTTIQRSDFNIAGDSVQFDTNAKTGRLFGNVKMVITDKSHLTAKPGTNK